MARIITGHTGVDHITSDDVSSFQKGVVGLYDYLLSDNPDNFSATINANGTISLCDADIIVQGTHIRIYSTDIVTLESGTNGATRVDSIIVRYTRDDDGIESAEVVAKVGSTSPPELVQTDIRGSGTIREVALWNVTLNGTIPNQPERVIPDVQSLKILQDAIETLQRKAQSIEDNYSSHSTSIKTINASISSINTAIKALQSNNTFSKVVYVEGKGTGNNTAFSGALRTYEAEYNKSGSKTTIINAVRMDITDKSKITQAGLVLYSNGRMNLFIGKTAYEIPFIQRGYITITPKTKVEETVGIVTTDKITDKITISGKSYTVTVPSKTYNVKRTFYEKTSDAIKFNKAYTSTPRIIVTPHSVAGHNLHWGISDVTTTGFKIYIERANTTATGFDWVAFGSID